MAIKLQMNVPETLELAFPDGLRVTSKFGGDQVMFSLTNGDKWYTDPFIASKIRDAKIGAYQPFNITKREIVTGNRRRVEYEIEALLEPKTITDPRPTVYAGESRDGKTTAVVFGAGASVNHFEDKVKGALNPPPPAAVDMVDVAARALGVAPVTPAVPSPSAVALMKMAGIGAVDAVLEIEKYAQSRGMVDFNFGADNIQKLTACLFIELAKKAGRV